MSIMVVNVKWKNTSQRSFFLPKYINCEIMLLIFFFSANCVLGLDLSCEPLL